MYPHTIVLSNSKMASHTWEIAIHTELPSDRHCRGLVWIAVALTCQCLSWDSALDVLVGEASWGHSGRYNIEIAVGDCKFCLNSSAGRLAHLIHEQWTCKSFFKLHVLVNINTKVHITHTCSGRIHRHLC